MIALLVFQDAELVVCHASLWLMILITSTTATTAKDTILEQISFADLDSWAFSVWFSMVSFFLSSSQ